jgi:hypothetical protein
VLFVLQAKCGLLQKVVLDHCSQIVVLSQMEYAVFAMTTGTRFVILNTDDKPSLLVPGIVVGLMVSIWGELG